MKRKKNKYDFLIINRALNGNWNGGRSYWGDTKNITKGETLKINRLIQKGGNGENNETHK